MTTTYRTSDTRWGAGKGSKLTKTELDENFYDKETRLTALEALELGNGIASITQSGDALTVHFDDGSTAGPFTLPTAAWSDRGEWAATTVYAVNDVFYYGASLYRVIYGHHAGASFDPNANDGSGHDYYAKIFGALGQFRVSELTDTEYTLALGESAKYFRCTGSNTAGVTTITIPLNDDVALEVNTELRFRVNVQNLAFAVADSAITLNVPENKAASTSFLGAVVTLKKVATDEWDLYGDLTQITV